MSSQSEGAPFNVLCQGRPCDQILKQPDLIWIELTHYQTTCNNQDKLEIPEILTHVNPQCTSQPLTGIYSGSCHSNQAANAPPAWYIIYRNTCQICGNFLFLTQFVLFYQLNLNVGTSNFSLYFLLTVDQGSIEVKQMLHVQVTTTVVLHQSNPQTSVNKISVSVWSKNWGSNQTSTHGMRERGTERPGYFVQKYVTILYELSRMSELSKHKSIVGKHTFMRIMIVQIRQNVRIIHISKSIEQHTIV